MSRSARWYRRLLWLSPGRLRREYADDMVAAFDAMLADARRRDLRFPRTRVWLRALVDLSVATVQSWRPGPNSPSPGPRNLMTSRLQDLRFALRVIRRQPLFALVTILTIAVGVGATTTIFALANGMLLRVPDGVRTADRLVTLHTLGEDGSSFHAFSIPEYRHLAGIDGPLEELAAHDNFTGSLVLAGVPYRVAGDIVSGNYFETLGTRDAAGRLFHADEDTVPGRDRVAVISHRLWQERFDGNPAAVGRQIRLNGRSFTVVGVTEPGFQFARVSPAYFDTMRIPLRAGRTFGSDDERGAPVAVVVNRHMAESFWPGADPLGEQIAFRTADEPIPATVVGVTANSKIRTPGDPDRPLVYVSWEQWRSRDYTLVARLQSPDVAGAVRDRIRELDPVLPPAQPVAYTELVGLSLLPLRVASLLATVFGGAGLLLAAIGLHGLLAYSVTRRSREIGVRMALGAPKTGVQRMVVSSGLRLTAAGLVVGLVAAAGIGRLIQWLLFGISPVDPLTFGGIAAILLLIAGAAAWIPARRAATIDPVDALRSE